MDLRVECYSGYRGEETPRHFTLGERRVEVTEVIDRWFGAQYILRHDHESQRWELILFTREP